MATKFSAPSLFATIPIPAWADRKKNLGEYLLRSGKWRANRRKAKMRKAKNNQ